MVEATIDTLILNSKKQMEWVKKFKKTRYLFNELSTIDKEYYVGIKGVRGVGKTVLLLQLARQIKDCVYFSADSTLVKSFSLYDIVKECIKREYKNIFIDEIHRKVDWDVDVKTLYDEHEVRIFFSGSSALNLSKAGADLSRRVVLKELRPASLREHLMIKKNEKLPILSFEDLITNTSQLAKTYAHVFEYVDEYLHYGGVLYPKNGFYDALENALKKIILQDLASLRDVNIKYETDVYKLLQLIARSPPYQTNYSSLAQKLNLSKTLVIRLVNDLHETGVLIPILPCKKQGVNVKKEPKIYLTIPLRHFFMRYISEPNIGALREEFFVNHIQDLCYIKGDRGEKTPDFRWRDYIIEVGGQSKSNVQHPDIKAVDSLVVEDNKIPLFLFGFLY
jgi:uncharacterized protein